MKKLISIFSIFAACLLMAACSSETDKDCKEVKKAMEKGEKETVAKTAAELYAKKAECSAANLVDLAFAYNFLAEKEMAGANDPANLSDYIEKALECYGEAVKIDSEEAANALKEAGKENFKQDLDELKARLQQAQQDEQALLEQINS